MMKINQLMFVRYGSMISKSKSSIPSPTTDIPDVATFLQRIGRNASEHAESFPTWEALFNTNGPALKTAGVDVQSRRYILDQLQRFRVNGTVDELPVSRKLNGGERKMNQHLAKKKILNRIELAKTQKILRKQDNAKLRLESKFDKIHKDLNHEI